MARVRPGEAANPAPPVVQRIRVRFAKRGRLRFLSTDRLPPPYAASH